MELKVDTSYKQILGMALPITLSMLVPQINFIINNVFLGSLGQQELASAGITGIYYLVFAVIGNGLNNGLQALIARRAGQNLPKEIGRLFYHGIWIALIIAVFGIGITFLLAPLIFNAVIHNTSIAIQAIDFLYIRIWGLPFLYLYMMRNALLVGTNQTRLLVWGTVSEALVNILLDYTLIYGHFGFPKLGFNGAAYASIAAEATGLCVIYIVIHKKGLQHSFSFFERLKWSHPTAKLILVQSLPLILQYAISIISWQFFFILVEHHGSRALAISNTMRNIFGLCGMFSWAFAATANSMVSNIIGQGRHREVLPLIIRISCMSFLMAALICVSLNIMPQALLSIYGQPDDFIQEAIPVMRIVSVALLTMSVGTVWLNSVAGTGNTMVNLGIELITITMYSLYVYFVLEYFNMSIAWGWLSEWVYWSAMLALAFFYMRSGKWKHKKNW